MKTLNEKLYDNLLENADNMTDEWLSYRIIKLGSVYSSAAGDDAVQMLRKQNRLTIRSIATRLSGQTGQFETMKRKWAELVAESRIRSNTPIHEVFDAVMRFRTVYWSYIERFIRANNHEVQRTDVLRWGSEMNQAFDELFHEFSRTYHEMTEERMIAQQKMIRELGTPVIKIDGERGILPLIGDIDSDRARILKMTVPERCAKLDIIHLFIDLSGVSIIDTMVAQQMYEFTQILSLLGIRSTVTGIRPEIAQTSIHLGLDFNSIATYGSLQQALENTPI
ncbi:STAS domain-containing protein [Bhargavaea beijingensis]|uniref:RsbT co-antagonist protein RsbR n=1 Tax=Bhargavaea beijingensis TaxID=426756 RepID=A0A1G7B9H8_9BACL|nr:STAS domain-containing protein [Bhargavaea beijingensis]MCW1928405.1 STAS domain-containing protein [Bhargavaea beijingensis]RSK32643.1 STAS domain-containing protein [Bhargavaea beijingensis]SDE23622.1 rsbT co-antagonist protein RsbR [Bhargavaea beijingensis]